LDFGLEKKRTTPSAEAAYLDFGFGIANLGFVLFVLIRVNLWFLLFAGKNKPRINTNKNKNAKLKHPNQITCQTLRSPAQEAVMT
jgi:hypothetical protein